MTPLYLNPPPSPFPVVELNEEQHLQLCLPPNQAAVASLSGPAFFNTAQDHQRVITELGDNYKVNNYINDHAGSRDHRRVRSSSSLQQPMVDDSYTVKHKLSLCKRSESSSTDNGSAKWMSSKVRLMQRMINSNCSTNAGLMNKQKAALKTTQKVQYHDAHQLRHNNKITSFNNSNNNTNIRVCTDCNTTTTPLWRSGPRGPKSLCNACGIRQRKARRAMEAAGIGTVVATDTASMKIKVQNKEKKSRTNVHVNAQYKKQLIKSRADNYYIPPHSQKKLCFKDFALSLSKNSAFGRVFPQDEEEAAILLMELSCGLLHG